MLVEKFVWILWMGLYVPNMWIYISKYANFAFFMHLEIIQGGSKLLVSSVCINSVLFLIRKVLQCYF